jgi:uncharacterized membrane protein
MPPTQPVQPTQHPVLWLWDLVRLASDTVGAADGARYVPPARTATDLPAVRRIAIADVRAAVADGFEDFKAVRSDVIFLCIIYPIVGLVFASLAFGNLVQLLFPLAGGFALLGPLAAVGINELSRRREAGRTVVWTDALSVVRSPSILSITSLGFMMVVIFLVWQFVAAAIFDATVGSDAPSSIGGLIDTLLFTLGGWALIIFGVGAGFLFAVFVFTISVVSFPVLLDRPVGVGTAVRTSIAAVLINPVPMGFWALIIVGGLVLGSIPLFIGLAVVMPVLGHATWHLYRRVVDDGVAPPLATR